MSDDKPTNPEWSRVEPGKPLDAEMIRRFKQAIFDAPFTVPQYDKHGIWIRNVEVPLVPPPSSESER